jgi:sugar phosphate isomerase/epimerase
MNQQRRNFLRTAATLALAPVALQWQAKAAAVVADNVFGLQLYSLRDDMPKDPAGVLKQIASFGYKQIESYEGPQGMFWGMGHTGFKKYMDDLGMDIIASHCNIDRDFEKKSEEAAVIGMKYLICPSSESGKTADDFKRTAEDFNRKGEICKKNGIRFGYHNHEYGFRAVDGQLPQDIMMTHTDPSLVDFEMDIYWVVTGGHDPIAWLEKYPGRFRLVHVKDRIRNATARDASCTLGTGSIDYPVILKAAKKAGVKEYIVEQEKYDGGTPLSCIKADAEYMRNLKEL